MFKRKTRIRHKLFFFSFHRGVEGLYWFDVSTSEQLPQETVERCLSEAVVAEVQLQPASKNGGCFVSLRSLRRPHNWNFIDSAPLHLINYIYHEETV